MRATRLIAATVLAFLWLGVSLLPWTSLSALVAGAVTLAVVGFAAVYERKHTAGSAESRRVALSDALQSRLRTLSHAQQRAAQSVEEDCREAVARLTGALPGKSPREALDALPWILVMGVPGSGRSTMLASSGLPFGYVTPPTGAQGPRSVRWWLTDRAAFIDTAGAHVAGEAGHAEWLTLLRTLESLRPAQPVHGVVVTVSADMLANGRPEDLDGWSRRLRERLDEVSGLLGVDVPVHLLVTRCDMIPGFAEFFADVREAERAQVWGFTLPLGGAATPAIERITLELQHILRVLSQRSVRRANVRDPLESRLAAFQFPLWFAAFRPNLLQVAATLFAQNRFQDALLARGVWFTSAAEARGYHAGTGAQSGRGYFLREVLSTHVAGDANLAVPSAAELRRRLHQRLLLATPLLCGAALTAALALTAYQANRGLLTDFTAAMNAAAAARTPMPVATLEGLRARTAELREHVEKGPPRWLRMGMFVGDRVAPRASTAFAVYALRDMVRGALETERRELVEYLGAASARPSSEGAAESARNNLRAYQLLTTPRLPGDADPRTADEAAWLAARLTERWSATHREASPDELARVLACARLYVAALADDPRLGTPRDLQLVSRATTLLRRP